MVLVPSFSYICNTVSQKWILFLNKEVVGPGSLQLLLELLVLSL